MDSSHGHEILTSASPSISSTRRAVLLQLSQRIILASARCRPLPVPRNIKGSEFTSATHRPFPGRDLLLQPHDLHKHPIHIFAFPLAPPVHSSEIDLVLLTLMSELHAGTTGNDMWIQHLQLVKRKTKPLDLKQFSYDHSLHSTIKLIHFKIDSFAYYLNKKIKRLNSTKAPDNIDIKINQICSKIESCNDDLQRTKKLLDSKIASYRFDLEKEVRLLNFILQPRDHVIFRTIHRLNSRSVSYSYRLNVKLKLMNYKLTSFYDFFKEIKQLGS